MRAQNQTNQPRHVGIRWRLFACLAGFTAVILLALWVFQIRLLGLFYEKEKFSDMNEIAQALSAHVGDKGFEQQAEIYARNNGVCIFLIKIEGSGASLVADVDVSSDCVIHHLSADAVGVLYRNAQKNGGVYNERMEFEYGSGERPDVHLPAIHPGFFSINAIHAEIFEAEGVKYFLLLDSELFPVGTVVRTLEMQFFWIVAALLVATVLFAALLSRMITKPLAEITKKAKRLADGDYEADDPVRGYREVQELADTLNYAAAEIKATDRLQKELIANISHDLRTPLTMIKGYSEMMRDIPGENSPENLQAIIDETTRLSELVNDLMDLSKLQSGAQKLALTVFDLTETVRDTLGRYDALIAHEGYRIVFEDAGSAMVEADRTMILQVIYNLINNAVNYTGESRRVVVREEIKGDRVRLSVADDGEGIAPDRIAEIWDRYYRVDKVHKRAVKGTGLGLSIVKGVLEAHRSASYGVDSALGVGSVFWFELPIFKDGSI